jgi:hypothetical protein
MADECRGLRVFRRRQQTAGMLSLTLAVGRSTLRFMRSRKAGRAECAPLRQPTGGAARTAAWEEKNANTDVCVFFYLSAPGHGPGAALPPLSR